MAPSNRDSEQYQWPDGTLYCLSLGWLKTICVWKWNKVIWSPKCSTKDNKVIQPLSWAHRNQSSKSFWQARSHVIEFLRAECRYMWYKTLQGLATKVGPLFNLSLPVFAFQQEFGVTSLHLHNGMARFLGHQWGRGDLQQTVKWLEDKYLLC